MIKKALEYIVGMSAPTITKIGGEDYSDKPLNRISYNPKAEPIALTTLTSLVDYIRRDIDVMPGKMIVHVKSPTSVSLYSALDPARVRERLAEVSADVPRFEFGHFIGHEEFCIALQAKFMPTDDRALLMKFAGTVEAGSVAEYGDDGITQKATIKTGIATKGDAIVPSPCVLKPYRTFVEVDQPESAFVFRMKQDSRSGEVMCALFEADGGAWRRAAMRDIADYLGVALAGYENFIVIS